MKKAYVLLLISLYLLVNPGYSLAATPGPTSSPLEGLGCGGNMGPIAEFLCKLSQSTSDPTQQKVKIGNKLNAVISTVINFLTIIAALWFLFQFVTAGFQWIGSGGDKTSLEAARDKITHSLIGLLIIASAWIIVGTVGTLLGIPILNPGKVLQDLGF